MDVLPSDLAKHHVWRGGEPEKQSAIITRFTSTTWWWCRP